MLHLLIHNILTIAPSDLAETPCFKAGLRDRTAVTYLAQRL